MDAGIKQSVDVRRGALYDCYGLPPDARAVAEELFGRMEELGSGCADQAEFERALLASPLTEEYNGLFAAFARYARPPRGQPSMEEIRRDAAAESTRSHLRNHAETTAKSLLVRMMPDRIYDWYVYGIHNVPVLGRIVSAMNAVGQFRRWFGRRGKEETNATPDNNN